MRFHLETRSVVPTDANPTCPHAPSSDDIERHLNELLEELGELPFLHDVHREDFQFTGLVIAPHDLDEIRTAVQQRFSDSFCYIRYVSLT